MTKTLLCCFIFASIYTMAVAQSDTALRAYHAVIRKIFRHEPGIFVGVEAGYSKVYLGSFFSGVYPNYEVQGYGFTLGFLNCHFRNTNAALYSFDYGNSFASIPFTYNISRDEVTFLRLVRTFPIGRGVYQLHLGVANADYNPGDVPLTAFYPVVDTTGAPLIVKTMGQVRTWTAVARLVHRFWIRNQGFSLSVTAHCLIHAKSFAPIGDDPNYHYYPTIHDQLEVHLMYDLLPTLGCSPYKTRPLQ